MLEVASFKSVVLKWGLRTPWVCEKVPDSFIEIITCGYSVLKYSFDTYIYVYISIYIYSLTNSSFITKTVKKKSLILSQMMEEYFLFCWGLVLFLCGNILSRNFPEHCSCYFLHIWINWGLRRAARWIFVTFGQSCTHFKPLDCQR